MRIPSLSGVLVAVCIASSAHADLSLSDLPYVQGTPIADGSWQIQDYSQNGDGIHWVWLQQGASTAYVVYPSEETTLLPDNSTLPANSDQMTLRFLGGADEELLFTRFSNALFTLIGDDVTVQYTAVTANTVVGAYPGDLSMSAREIHVDGELTLDGSMKLDVLETVALYGSISVADNLWIGANTGVIMGAVENNGTLLDTCNTNYSSTQTSIHIEIEIPLTTKGCLGDVRVGDVALEHEPLAISTVQTATQTSGRSKGGSIDWLWLTLFAPMFFYRRRTSNSRRTSNR